MPLQRLVRVGVRVKVRVGVRVEVRVGVKVMARRRGKGRTRLDVPLQRLREGELV